MMNFLRSLGRRYLDTTLNTGGGFVTRILDRPGHWMSQDELDKLSADLREIASHTLASGSLTYGVFSADRERLEHSVITLVTRKSDGKPIAFNALVLMDIPLNGAVTRVLHLGLVMVDPNERSKGFSWVLYGLTCLLLLLRNGLRPIHISNVTQVPAVVGMVSETFSNVFPSPHNTVPRDFKKLQLARGIMKDHRHVFGVGADAEFDEATFVISNAYTGGSDDLKKTYEQATKHRDEAYNTFCAERLDYVRGDDVLQLCQIDLNAAKRFVTRTVPRASLAGVAVLTGLVLLRRAILPVLHWFNPRKNFGILRPHKS